MSFILECRTQNQPLIELRLHPTIQGVKCDYDGHEKRFYNNLMLGTSAGCWHTCAYKKGFPDYCHDNTLIQGTRTNPRPGQAPVPPYAIIWFCDAKNVSHILPDYNNEVSLTHTHAHTHTHTHTHT